MGEAKEAVDLVSFPDDLVSNDSSFIGDEEMQASYEKRAATSNPRSLWEIHDWNLQCIIVQERAALSQPKAHHQKRKLDETGFKATDNPKSKAAKRESSATPDKPKKATSAPRNGPFNPYADNPAAYQLHETIPDFFDRLRPSTTTIAASGSPWIYIANPYASRYGLESDVGGFKQTGLNLLDYLRQARQTLESQYSDKPLSSITRMLKPERDQCEAEIVRLAKEKNVTRGKWMLFPYPSDVDAVWKKVAQATLDDRLGCAAKVATDHGENDKPLRLVCIYTEDFSDLEDVKRVLREMRDLGLVKDSFESMGNKGVVYYKSDAYTYLDIGSDNEYKLKASMYNSRDLFKEMSEKRWS